MPYILPSERPSPSFNPSAPFTPLRPLPKRKPIQKRALFKFNEEQDQEEADDDPPKLMGYPSWFSNTLISATVLDPPPSQATSSPPLILPNGKPLKSSLKSSSSSPFPAVLRAHSAPAAPTSLVTSKNVHFANELESVRIFDQSSRPANISGPADEEIESEAEEESLILPSTSSPPVIDADPTTSPFESSISHDDISLGESVIPTLDKVKKIKTIKTTLEGQDENSKFSLVQQGALSIPFNYC